MEKSKEELYRQALFTLLDSLGALTKSTEIYHYVSVHDVDLITEARESLIQDQKDGLI